MTTSYYRNLHKCCVTMVSMLLMYDYYRYAKTKTVLIEDPQFSLLGPYNNSIVGLEDDYDKLMDLKNFTFLSNPQPCISYTNGLLLITLVASKPSHIENRVVIRNTWGRNTDSNKLVFLIGETEDESIKELIKNEIYIYEDLVQGNFNDAYRNMTYKHVMGLKWVAHHCPQAKYVLKSDDDIVTNMNALTHFLSRDLSPFGAKNLILCSKQVHARVFRNETKWIVTVEEYKPEFYPNYCSGFVIVYSQDVVRQLLKAARTTPYFWIDDVHVTGILAQTIPIEQTPLDSLILSPTRVRMLVNLGSKYIGTFLFGPRDLSVDKIMSIWNSISS